RQDEVGESIVVHISDGNGRQHRREVEGERIIIVDDDVLENVRAQRGIETNTAGVDQRGYIAGGDELIVAGLQRRGLVRNHDIREAVIIQVAHGDALGIVASREQTLLDEVSRSVSQQYLDVARGLAIDNRQVQVAVLVE